MRRFFAPKSVAVIGASSNPLAIGGQPIRQLVRHGYTGNIYPVNPNRDRVQDLRCYPSVADLPAGVDVAWPVKIRLNPPIHAQPGAIDFRTVPQGAEKEREILLAAFANRAFKVTGARSERRQVRVAVPDHAPGTAWRVLVSLPKGLAAGLVNDRVVIETDDPDVPQVVIPVTAEIR